MLLDVSSMGFSPYCSLNSPPAVNSLLTVLISYGKISVSVLVQSGKQKHFELWRKGFIRGNRPGQLWKGLGDWHPGGSRRIGEVTHLAVRSPIHPVAKVESPQETMEVTPASTGLHRCLVVGQGLLLVNGVNIWEEGLDTE